jgi:hypothetical protein
MWDRRSVAMDTLGADGGWRRTRSADETPKVASRVSARPGWWYVVRRRVLGSRTAGARQPIIESSFYTVRFLQL